MNPIHTTSDYLAILPGSLERGYCAIETKGFMVPTHPEGDWSFNRLKEVHEQRG